jgi:hypothetical protein
MKLRHSVFGCFAFAILVGSGCTTSAKKAESPAATTTEAKPSKTSPGQPASAPSSPADSGALQVGATAVNPAATVVNPTAAAVTATAAAVNPAAAAVTPAATAANPAATPEIASAALPVPAGANIHGSATEAAVSPARSGSPVVGAPPVDIPTPEMVRKRAQIEWALRQDEIKHDPRGQWAVQAKASSTYNDGQDTAPYSASQATGAPNVEVYGSNSSAWSPKTPNGGIEWLELQFAKPVHATSVRVRESSASGAVIKVDLFDEQGTAHTVWTGIDPTTDLNYLTVEFPRTAFKTSRVKVTLATNTVGGFKQIDAVQLLGTEQ